MRYVIGMKTVRYNQRVKRKRKQVLRTKAMSSLRTRCVKVRNASNSTTQEAERIHGQPMVAQLRETLWFAFNWSTSRHACYRPKVGRHGSVRGARGRDRQVPIHSCPFHPQPNALVSSVSYSLLRLAYRLHQQPDIADTGHNARFN